MGRGESPTLIARILGVRRTSPHRWREMARAAPDGLAARPHPGPKPRLTAEQLQELGTLLRRGATAHGWPTAQWTAHRVAQLIRRHTGVGYHVEHARKILRRRLGWSSQAPQEKAKQRNTEKIDHRRRRELPEILRKAGGRKAHPVFLDESGFRMTPVVRRTYAPRGQTPIVEAFDRKGKVSAISAVTVGAARRRCRPSYRLLPGNANAHGEGTVSFLAGLRRRLRGPMTIVWDRGHTHQRCGLAKAYLARHPEVVTEQFPGYAPDASPDEGVWGWAKYHGLPSFAPGDLEELRSRLEAELSSLDRRGDLLASFIRHAEIPLRL
jgi:transposase